MTQIVRVRLYHRHCFPAEVIAHAVWHYIRFPLSLWVVEDFLAALQHQLLNLTQVRGDNQGETQRQSG